MTLNPYRLCFMILVETLQILFFSAAVLSFFPIDTTPMHAILLEKHWAGYKADWQLTVYRLTCLSAVMLTAFYLMNASLRRYFNDNQLGYVTLIPLYLMPQTIGALGILTGNHSEMSWGIFGLGLALSCACRLLLKEAHGIVKTLAVSNVFRKSFAVMLVVYTGVLFYIIFDAQGLARSMLVLMGLGLAACVIWLWIKARCPLFSCAIFQQAAGMLFWASSQRVLHLAGIFIVGALIILMMHVTDPLAVIAKTAFGEHFLHFDVALMSAAYAAFTGNIIGVDHLSMYGMGMGVLVAALVRLIYKNITYLNVFVVYVGLCILYALGAFIFFKKYFKSLLLATAAVFIFIKWQLFYTMSYPMPFFYPNGSVLRCLLDIIVFFFLLSFVRHKRARYLWASAIVIGLALFYSITTGFDLWIAFAAFACALAYIEQKKYPLMHVLAAAVLGLLLIGIYVGPAVFTVGFWKDLIEYPYLFAIGLYKLPFWENLSRGRYWEFAAGCLIPLMYLATIITGMIRIHQKRVVDHNLLMIFVSVYGLSLLQHYVSMGVHNNYYMRALPIVTVLFWWIAQLLERIRRSEPVTLIKWALVFICAFLLWTNKTYRAYPNIFNASRNPMVDPKTAYPLPEDGRPYFFHKDWLPPNKKLPLNSLGNTNEFLFSEWQIPNHAVLKELYAQQFDFRIDAALIQSLTKSDEKVPLIASFEIEMLLQAKRRPFFFQFPLIAPRALSIPSLPESNILSQDSLRRTIDALEKSKPTYVFMERAMLVHVNPKGDFRNWHELIAVIDYVQAHYKPYKTGQYLVAMQRIAF